jgi:hypothetical protein
MVFLYTNINDSSQQIDKDKIVLKLVVTALLYEFELCSIKDVKQILTEQ